MFLTQLLFELRIVLCWLLFIFQEDLCEPCAVSICSVQSLLPVKQIEVRCTRVCIAEGKRGMVIALQVLICELTLHDKSRCAIWP